MEDYKYRFIQEYTQLKQRYEKLKKLNNKYEVDVKYSNNESYSHLGFKPSCPYSLLRDQQRVMGEYLHILETRAVIEGIELENSNTKCSTEVKKEASGNDLINRVPSEKITLDKFTYTK